MLLGANPLIEVVPGLMVWTIVAFAITLWFLKRYAFGPAQKYIDDRRDRIRQTIDEADKRTHRLTLTPSGRALLVAALPGPGLRCHQPGRPSRLGPVSSSTACSGCGIRPTTLPDSLQMPATPAAEPFGMIPA